MTGLDDSDVTQAEGLTDWPNTLLVGTLVTPVCVVALFTVCVRAALVELLKFASPL
jgi:hypothetical protein